MNKRAVRYLLTIDVDGDELVWEQYRDGTVRATALGFMDLRDSETPVLDLTGADL